MQRSKVDSKNQINNFKASNIIEKYYWLFFFVLISIIAFCCFYQLGSAPIEDWDEARHGVNAYEMIKNNNYIANYYNGSLDYGI